MDTSETYIKMCEKSQEVQRLWHPADGDFVWHPNEGEDIWGAWEFPAEHAVVKITEQQPIEWWTNWMWLPRQDQLQEIAHGQPYDYVVFYWTTFQHFILFTASVEGYTGWVDNKTSMEQLWLAFVMKEKCNKIWNSTDWQ